MEHPTSDLAFTPAVKAEQHRLGSRRGYRRLEEAGGFAVAITEELADFIAQRDSLFLGTASAAGRPYIQHRGGPPGFVKPLDPTTLGMADYSGNRQYISLGNLSENDAAFLFLIDHATRTRFKLWGRARFVEGDRRLEAAVATPDYAARVERVLVFEIQAWDRNCPQHIPRQFGEQAVQDRERALSERIVALQAEVDRLRGDPPASA